MSCLVIDASVAIKWVVDEAGSDIATRLLDRPLAAPDLLSPECANNLWKKVTRGQLSADEADIAAATLEAAEITVHPTRAHLRAATELACALGHPAYDCFYLALARHLSTCLVTADLRLIEAVRARSNPELADLAVSLQAFGAS